MNLLYFALGPAVLLGLVLPAVLILVRETVKLHRQDVVQDLAAVFDATGSQRMIPSFEFVKFKYFLKDHRSATNLRKPRDFSAWAWLAALLPFALVTVTIAWVAFMILLTGRLPPPFDQGGVAIDRPPDWWGWAFCSAFLGAYLMVMRNLYRAINNFDLSPVLYIGAAMNILGGVALSVLVVSAAGLFWPEMSIPSGAAIVLAFAIGFFPEAAQRMILRESRLRNFKRENIEIYRMFQATPIEVIDGIDTEIRDRLADYHITSAQNLAAANPLMLFVETPFGVYQIMDWVAQAQLCSSVGADTMIGLSKLGVRTLFDLERAALSPKCRDSALLQAIGKVLFQEGPATAAANGGSTGFSEAAIIANVQMRLDDPHVHRLRQIYIRVGDCIGRDSLRFGDRDLGDIVGVMPPKFGADANPLPVN